MSGLINISNQVFYTSTVEDLSSKIISNDKCALIISENDIESLMSESRGFVDRVNHAIIISENLDTVSAFFEGINVLLISAKNLSEAVNLSIIGDYSEEVIYVTKNGADDLQEVAKSYKS